MRETLTVLAGLLVLALLAALIGPGFVDWRDYRPQFEARIASALGVETRIAGGIGQGKMKYLPRELGLALEPMRAIKRALDPSNILNPGKIFTL